MIISGSLQIVHSLFSLFSHNERKSVYEFCRDYVLAPAALARGEGLCVEKPREAWLVEAETLRRGGIQRRNVQKEWAWEADPCRPTPLLVGRGQGTPAPYR